MISLSRLHIIKMGLETGKSILINTQRMCMTSYTRKIDQCAKDMTASNTRSYEVNLSYYFETQNTFDAQF